MGTRADFYVGRGADAEWLGSIHWDGYPSGIDPAVLGVPTVDTYRAAVAAFLASRDDATLASAGWPWPWPDSGTTDFAYAFDAGAVWASYFGRAWFNPAVDMVLDGPQVVVFPNMRQSDPHALFGDAVDDHRVTRADLLADGGLVDVSAMAAPLFTAPVAVSRALMADIADIPPAAWWQDVPGRLRDVLWMGYLAIKRAPDGGDALCYQLILPVGDETDVETAHYPVKLLAGPGDDGELVITLLKPGED